jgi:hypothetical protein
MRKVEVATTAVAAFVLSPGADVTVVGAAEVAVDGVVEVEVVTGAAVEHPLFTIFVPPSVTAPVTAINWPVTFELAPVLIDA